MKMAENITEQYTGTLNDMERCGTLRNVGYGTIERSRPRLLMFQCRFVATHSL